MLKSQEYFFYNRWRAKDPKPLRMFYDMRFGLPEGYRDANSTVDIENRAAKQAAALVDAGFYIDKWIEWGYDPQTAYMLNGKAVPDPSTFKPFPDMDVTNAVQPFSPWVMESAPEFEQGTSQDRYGVGSLWDPKPGDALDIGAWWTGTIAIPNTAVTISGKWEKVMWRVANSRPIAWERIA